MVTSAIFEWMAHECCLGVIILTRMIRNHDRAELGYRPIVAHAINRDALLNQDLLY